MASSNSVSLPIVNAVQQINQQQPGIVVAKLKQLLGSLEGKTIGILGLSFKPDSDDMREASSLLIISLLEEHGCQVKAYDPVAMGAAARLLPKVTYCLDAYEAATSSDALILVTDWDEFKGVDMIKMGSLMNTPILIDGRNLYNPQEMTRAGFIYEGIGRGATGHHKLETEIVSILAPNKARL